MIKFFDSDDGVEGPWDSGFGLGTAEQFTKVLQNWIYVLEAQTSFCWPFCFFFGWTKYEAESEHVLFVHPRFRRGCLDGGVLASWGEIGSTIPRGWGWGLWLPFDFG